MGEAPHEREVAAGNAARPISRGELRHTLLNPLNQIIGYSELLKEEAAARGHEGYLADLDRIAAAGRRLVELVREHLADSDDRTVTPTSVRSPTTAPTLTPTPTGAHRVERSGRLLVVDDGEENRELLARHLRQRGHRVELAESGDEALRRVAQERYDLVLLDVVMPGLGGLETLVAIREQRGMSVLPVIMTTARDSSDDVVQALHLGANDYVTKPLDLAVVHARIQTQLSLKHARDRIADLNTQLEQAQQRIARLAASSSRALHDVGAWCLSVLDEVKEAAGADEVTVWSCDGGLKRIAGDPLVEPTTQELQQLEQGDALPREDDLLLAVRGFSGKLVGAVALAPGGVLASDDARQLVDSFRVHLGGVLEMDRLRHNLAVAAEQRQATRQEMIRRGIDVLQVCSKCGRCYDQRVERCAADGFALGGPRAFPYRVVDRYRLVRFLGKGGMGSVYHARDEQLDRDVAIKILHPRHFDDATIRVRFENEARALARIAHPGVVAVHDCGALEDGSMFLVVELLRGCDLKALLRSHGRGRPTQVAALLRQGAAALGAAHDAGLVHRDIKPENVFAVPAAKGMRFKLLDFGISKEISAGEHLTRTGDLVGTPMYMAPEQLTGGALDERTDLYSFAAVAFEALVGRRVFEGRDLAEVLVETYRSGPPTVSAFLDGASPAIDAAFARALARRPEDRPARVSVWVDSFVDELEALSPTGTPGWPDTLETLLSKEETPTCLDRPRPGSPTAG